MSVQRFFVCDRCGDIFQHGFGERLAVGKVGLGSDLRTGPIRQSIRRTADLCGGCSSRLDIWLKGDADELPATNREDGS